MKPLSGSKFQIKVWEEIKKIPKGKTRSYQEIAVSIGKPNSARGSKCMWKKPLSNYYSLS